ncbi:DUF4097 family beta strand repeat-containing protein [Nocardiopsis composta]|uniref:DUF4097 domain-containing protein n=1 Tax=Nocardiopsis composta TaxID=157465 RepID=A0A7W8VDZ6_9ACTN|nr:DUF4097 family beta strand repeat-containing protein [Nocardiopsis composta]MBB5433001.1 hypothetical protein [Nocardiopsis composta]
MGWTGKRPAGRAAAVAGALAAVAALPALGGCGAVEVNLDSTVETEERAETYPGAESVRIGNPHGDTEVRGGDVDGVRVELVLEHTGDRPPEEQVSEGDGELRLKAPADCDPDRIAVGVSVCRIAYTVTVPYGTGVELESATGAITVADTRGAVTASASNGDVEASGELESLDASSDTGTVTADAVDAPRITLRSGNGDVTAAAAAPVEELTAESGTGTVEVELAGGADYAIEASSDTGEVRRDAPHTPGGAPVTAHSDNGDVTVALAAS